MRIHSRAATRRRLLTPPVWTAAASEARHRFPRQRRIPDALPVPRSAKAASRFACRRSPYLCRPGIAFSSGRSPWSAQGGVTARKNLLGKLVVLELVYQNWPATREFVLSETQLARLVEPRSEEHTS